MSYQNNIIAGLVLAASSGLANAGSIITNNASVHSLPALNNQLPITISKHAEHADLEVCGTDENHQDWHQLQKLNVLQLKNKSSFANKLLKQLSAKNSSASVVAGNGVAGRYYIPVVFHVYGARYNCTDSGGYCLTDADIVDGLNKTNEDFLGTNTQDGPILPEFQAIRDSLNVEFVLAKKDPNGNATTGIVRHGEQAGYGKGSGYDSEIAADAWDNFKYMNVYIMRDLKDDGKTNRSGVAWYPELEMSQAGLSRVVY
ncbi:MAG: collagenase, partial [Algicola sp.]|nr:collagenase [Algicola sp.]